MLLSACLVLVVVALGASGGDPAKKRDAVDAIPPPTGRLEITGTLDEASSTWQRWRPFDTEAVGLACDLPLAYEYEFQPAFDLVCFEVADAQPVEVAVGAASFDTCLYIYCDPFDPLEPTRNGVVFDDDDGPGLLSAIVAADGVVLAPGARYWLVLSAYGDGLGSYTITTGANVILCGSVRNHARSWSALKQSLE